MSRRIAARSTPGLHDVYRDFAVAPAACSIKAALDLVGMHVGARGSRTSSSTAETATVRSMLERHGLLQAARA